MMSMTFNVPQLIYWTELRANFGEFYFHHSFALNWIQFNVILGWYPKKKSLPASSTLQSWINGSSNLSLQVIFFLQLLVIFNSWVMKLYATLYNLSNLIWNMRLAASLCKFIRWLLIVVHQTQTNNEKKKFSFFSWFFSSHSVFSVTF